VRIFRQSRKVNSTNFAMTEFLEVRYTQAMSNNRPFGGCDKYQALDIVIAFWTQRSRGA
jgi:hypothetical protein